MKPIQHFEKNTLGTDYVVGDIHGHFGKLEVKLQEIGFNHEVDRLFSVGDLVDRGPDSEMSIDYLAKPWFHAVRGNHEQMAIDFMTYPVDSYNYIRNGGAWLIALPREHQQLFADEFSFLPLAIEVETDNGLVGIIHAEVPVACWDDLESALTGPNQLSFENVAMWSRDKINRGDDSSVDGVNRVYVGHTPLTSHGRLGNVYYIDTGACFNGKLTVFNIQTGEEV